MTQVSSDDVRHLAQLSSLGLADSEVEILRQNLSDILAYVEQLEQLDTEGVEPTYQVTDLENIWREDTVVASDVSRQQLLDLAPESHNYQVKVPKVL